MRPQFTRSSLRAIESNSISNSGSMCAGQSQVIHRVIPTRLPTSRLFRSRPVILLAPAVDRGIERALGMVVSTQVMQDLLTLKEVERELGVSRSTLWRLRKLGLLRTVALGRIVRVRRQDLTRFIEREMLSGRSL